MLTEGGLIRLMNEAAAVQPEAPLAHLVDAFTGTYGSHLRDDLTAVWIRRR